MYTPFFIAEIILGRLLSGIVPILIKLTSANQFEIGIFRLVLASGTLFLILALIKKLPQFTKQNILLSIVTGACFGLHWLTSFISIKISSVTIAMIGSTSYGIFLMILGYIFFGETISKKEIGALILAIIGSIITIPSFSLENSITTGLLVGLLSSLL